MRILILHIVRSGETITKIADNYQVEVSDITSNNFHITDFKNLKPGMKLKIPFISVPVLETLEETETFISDYYPSLNSEFNKENVIKEETVKEEVINTQSIIPEVKEEIINIQPVNPEVKKEIIEQQVEKKDSIKDLKPVSSYYQGHIIPNIDQKYIRKI